MGNQQCSVAQDRVTGHSGWALAEDGQGEVCQGGRGWGPPCCVQVHGSDLARGELIMLSYSKSRWEAEAALLLGTYMELVVRDAVTKHKELLVGTVKGVLRAKVGQLASRAAPEVIFP